MSINAKCSNCGKEYVLDDELLGKKVKCKDCGEVFLIEEIKENIKFKIYARAIIKDSKGRILLLKKHNNQKYGAGEYLLPGGTLEFGENIEFTLKRELKEETNLTLFSLKLFDTKKILINNEHWLGLYYIVNVNDSLELKNMEPKKHDFCDFVYFSDRFKILDRDIINKYLYSSSINNIFFEENIYTYSEIHTMGDSIYRYIDIKIHHLLKENIYKYKYVKVIGEYDRKNAIISKNEKKGKLFNWKRPTAIMNGDTIIIKCFPGIDYIKHYYYLINTYLYINNIKDKITYYELPSNELLNIIFNNYDFNFLKNSDYVILGNIDKLGLLKEIEYKCEKDFKYKVGKINGKKIVLLGCEFSLWGDIGGYLIKKISNYNIKNIIYIGKLGTLNKGIVPNVYLATGDFSLLNGKIIRWNNLFKNINESNLIYGKHITCQSIILEDKNWLQNNLNFDFVDPEIGQYAKFANDSGVGFSYLHITSDNLISKYDEDLSNEKEKHILDKRKILFKKINNFLLKVIQK